MRGLEKFGWCALAIPVLVSGCGGAPVLYNHSVYNRYSPTEFGVAAGRKDLKTVVHGDPFGMGQERFDEATVAILNRHEPPPQPTNFTLEPDESANLAYRVVLVFDAPDVSTVRLCREAAPRGSQNAGDDGTLHVTAAFCLKHGELTAVKGKVAEVESVEDPKFDRLLGQIVIALFPRSDPNQDDDDNILLLGRR